MDIARVRSSSVVLIPAAASATKSNGVVTFSLQESVTEDQRSLPNELTRSILVTDMKVILNPQIASNVTVMVFLILIVLFGFHGAYRRRDSRSGPKPVPPGRAHTVAPSDAQDRASP